MQKRTLFGLVMTIIALGVMLWMKNFYVSGEIIKTAVKKDSLLDKPYILCKEAWVTGFDWVMIRDENDNEVYAFCNIIGPTPYTELPLRYEFSMAHNIFVFYVLERNEYYSEAMKENCVEYIVGGWDILYPIKHGNIFGVLRQNKYITTDDIN